jgi:beta-galactosidase
MKPTTFRGQALLIIQPQDEKGVVNITASSPKFDKQGTFSVVME